jgi:hypothetical protein
MQRKSGKSVPKLVKKPPRAQADAHTDQKEQKEKQKGGRDTP